jgi:thioredoxin
MTIEHLDLNGFKEKIFDFEASKEWKYKDSVPCLIDFYADWCGPCKALAPVLEQLAREYDGRVRIFKVNTEHEQELAAMFGIRSIPSLLFVPVTGEPQMAQGALPKNVLTEAFRDVLGVKDAT